MTEKFQIGDRVRFTDNDYFGDRTVNVGIVTDLPSGDGTMYEIQSDGLTWYRFECELTKVEAEKQVGHVITYDPKEGPPGFYDRKFDQGKRDYSLLPAHAVSLVFDQENSLRSEDDGVEACEADDSLACAVEYLFDFRAGNDADDLLSAYVFSCRDRVMESLDGVVGVLEHGAKKYARDSWREVPDAANRYFSAAMRHAFAISRGERNDPDSGLNHWDHFRCNILFLCGLTFGEGK